MAAVGGVAIALSTMFAALVVILLAEVFYVFYWKRRTLNRIRGTRISCVDTERSGFDFDFSRESTGLLGPNYPSVPDPEIVAKLCSEVVGTNSSLYMQGVLGGPRLLFTIKEETKEDMESEEASKSTLQSKFYESDEESKIQERKNEQWQFAYTIGLMSSLRSVSPSPQPMASYSDQSKGIFFQSSSDSSFSPKSCMFSHPSSPPPPYLRSSSLSSPSWRSSSCSPSVRFESPRSKSLSRQSSFSVSTNPMYCEGEEFFTPSRARFSSQGTTPFGTAASSPSGLAAMSQTPPVSPPLTPIMAPPAAYSLPLLVTSLSRDSSISSHSSSSSL